ncbi:MAG: hypothetical protein ACFFCV_00540 [Promethearchaeota archaeon]
MSEKKKDSNELLNILMIIIGGLFVLMGLINILAWLGIDVGFAISIPAILGSSGLVSIVLGFWCLISGIGMFREEEYAMGMGLVVLSVMAVQTLSIMLTWGGTEWWTNWINYIILIAFIIGVLGFFWLVFTYKRYD